jgi:hypothetical protein
LPGTRHRNQHISQTDRVFFDIAEVEEALMAGATLPAMSIGLRSGPRVLPHLRMLPSRWLLSVC